MFKIVFVLKKIQLKFTFTGLKTNDKKVNNLIKIFYVQNIII